MTKQDCYPFTDVETIINDCKLSLARVNKSVNDQSKFSSECYPAVYQCVGRILCVNSVRTQKAVADLVLQDLWEYRDRMFEEVPLDYLYLMVMQRIIPQAKENGPKFQLIYEFTIKIGDICKTL
jgi:hypothetical protein